jgi:SAM-dependent methyltransferase
LPAVASLFRTARRHLPSPVADFLRRRRHEVVRLATGVDLAETAARTAAVGDEVRADFEQRTLDLLARQDAILAGYDRRVAALVNRVLDLEERLAGGAADQDETRLAPHTTRSPLVRARMRAAVDTDPQERKLLEERTEAHTEVIGDRTPVLVLGPETADPFVELARWDDASLGAVSVVGLVETMELDDLDRLFRAVHRSLFPGGVVVVESLYPATVDGLARFWRHPLRVRPWDAATLEALARHPGLEVVEVRAHPGPDGDYALIARRSS